MTQHILLIWSSVVSNNVILDRHKLQTAGVLTLIMGTISSPIPKSPTHFKLVYVLCMFKLEVLLQKNMKLTK